MKPTPTPERAGRCRPLAWTLTLTLGCWSALCATPAMADGVAVIANRGVGVEQIGAEAVTRVFLKQATRWPDGQAAEPVDLKDGHPLRAEFYAKVTGRSVGQVRAYWARQSFTGMALPPRQLATPEEVERYVAQTPGAVGYVERRQPAPSGKVRTIHEATD